MKMIKIVLIVFMMFNICCSSTQSSVRGNSDIKPAVVKTTADITEEKISIYGLIKEDSGNVYIVTNWTSKSMVTYTVTGTKKSELAKNVGKYASASGILTQKQTWSGTIEVKNINSIDKTPDSKKEKTANFKNFKPRK